MNENIASIEGFFTHINQLNAQHEREALAWLHANGRERATLPLSKHYRKVYRDAQGA